jgi:hypothetical protein
MWSWGYLILGFSHEFHDDAERVKNLKDVAL